MAKTLRVHNIAKEINVPSKVIVAKCQAEGLSDITNHMSTVKLGLAETIRQWFSEGHELTTAVETADAVDQEVVKKAAARKRAKPKAKKPAAADDKAETQADQAAKSTGATENEADDAAKAAEVPADAEMAKPTEEPTAAESSTADVEVAEDTTAAEATSDSSKKSSKSKSKPADDEITIEDLHSKAKKADHSKDEVAEEKPAEPKQPLKPVGKMNVPDRPNVIKPAGEQLVKPATVKLSGPKVVRVEKPEPVAPPRPKRGPGGGGGPGGRRGNQEREESIPAGTVPGIARSQGPARGRGAGGGMVEEGDGRGGGGGGRGKPRRQSNMRRGRSGDSLLSGPTKLTKADLDELDAKLKGSTGFVRKRRADMRRREEGAGPAQSLVETGGKVEIEEPITIKGLSSATGIKSADIIKYLFTQKKVMANVNSAIETEAAMEIAMEYEIELEVKEQKKALDILQEEFKDAEETKVDVRPRPPIVTVLGHVDHGKTSLLDRIRREDVAAHESGGITQHVGAYRVTVTGADGEDKTVVFLDTPGHQAFTSMRARGAQMTDIIVLVVAADDGVMPQTIESINHAKAAGVPIVVALNKIDTPQANEDNIQKIYGQLAEHGVNPTAWGGETEVVKTSAETGEGVTELIEILDLQSEVMELTADYGTRARGTIIEGEMQPGRGSVARVLVQNGYLKIGSFFVAGRAYGRVRDMTDDRNKQVKEVGPATPVELSGIDGLPDAGDPFYITDTLQKAERIAAEYRLTERNQKLVAENKVTMDNFAATIQAGKVNYLNVVLKGDVQGSLEVLRKSLEDVGNDEVAVRVLHTAVGGITESDVILAEASNAIILGFHVTATTAVKEIADERGVEIRLYRVIYELIDEVKQALSGMLAPERKIEEIGQAEVKEVFKISKVGNIAGCLVTEGSMLNSAKVRLERDGVVVTDERDIEALRRVKDEAKEVRAGTECGIRIAGFEDVKAGDIITCYKVVEIARQLD